MFCFLTFFDVHGKRIKAFFTSVTQPSIAGYKENLPETRIVYSFSYFVLDFSHRISKNYKTVINENIALTIKLNMKQANWRRWEAKYLNMEKYDLQVLHLKFLPELFCNSLSFQRVHVKVASPRREN